MISIIHIFFIMCSIVIFYEIIKERKNIDKHNMNTIISLIIMIFGGVIDIILYILNISKTSGVFFELGLIIFFIIQIKHIINIFHINYTKSINAKVYKKMAYTDALTNILNRAAFEKAINEINSNIEQYNIIGAVIFDLNNLKVVNDTFGHKFGDKLIVSFASILKENYINMRVFRTGGDEFFVLLENISYDDSTKLISDLYRNIEYNNKMEKIKISVAYGMDYYIEEYKNGFNDVIKKADENMYKMKVDMKKE